MLFTVYRCTPTPPVTVQILINDVITYSSSKPGVIFIKNEDEAKLPSWRKNKVAFIEFLLCTYHLCQPRKYVILFSLFKWGGGEFEVSQIYPFLSSLTVQTFNTSHLQYR